MNKLWIRRFENLSEITLFIAAFIFLLFAGTAAAIDPEPFFNMQVTNEPIKSFSISPDFKYMAAASEDEFIHFFNENGTLMWKREISDGMVSEIATNGEYIVVGSNYPETGQKETGLVRLFSNSGNLIFSKAIVPEDSNYSSKIKHVAISGDGNTIIVSGNREVYILDKTGHILNTIQVNESVIDASISESREFGALSSEDTIYIFNSIGGVFQKFDPGNNSIKGISISDGGYIAILTPQAVFLYKNNLKLWEKTAKTGNFFASIYLSPDGNLTAVTSTRDGMFLYDRNGVGVLQHSTDFKYVSTDGRLMAGVRNSFLYLFNITSSITGSISVLSTQGAQVYIDEKFAGTVPAAVSNVSAGTHTVKIFKKGYETWVQDIDISYGDKKEISIMLAPSIPVTTPLFTPAPDIVIIPKNVLYIIISGVILIAASAVVYLKKMKLSFPFPGAVSTIPEVRIDDSKPDIIIGAICPYCGDIIKATSRISVCPDCETPHHGECWEKHGRCTTFGCKNTL